MTSFGPIGRFFEGPRWRQGHWWVSDMTNRVVVEIDASGSVKQRLTFDDRPSGLGWLSDGSLLVVGMDSHTLHRVAATGASRLPYADFGGISGDIEGHLNDMVDSLAEASASTPSSVKLLAPQFAAAGAPSRLLPRRP